MCGGGVFYQLGIKMVGSHKLHVLQIFLWGPVKTEGFSQESPGGHRGAGPGGGAGRGGGRGGPGGGVLARHSDQTQQPIAARSLADKAANLLMNRFAADSERLSASADAHAHASSTELFHVRSRGRGSDLRLREEIRSSEEALLHCG